MTNTTTQMLIKFVNQRARLEFANYGDVKTYRSESREITKDRNDFFELLSTAQMRIDNFETKLTDYLTKNNSRLSLKDGKLEYITGQYFPTEYRPAANRVLATLIWADYRDEKHDNGETVYTNGSELRKATRRRLSRRVCKFYFN